MVSVEKKTRFTNSSEKDLRRLVEAAIPKNTKKATTFRVDAFHEFCQKKKLNLLSICRSAAPQSSRSFVIFIEVLGLRTKNGELYKKSSYLAARASIGRYVTVDLEHPTINVFKTPELQKYNRVLNAILIENKLRGET